MRTQLRPTSGENLEAVIEAVEMSGAGGATYKTDHPLQGFGMVRHANPAPAVHIPPHRQQEVRNELLEDSCGSESLLVTIFAGLLAVTAVGPSGAVAQEKYPSRPVRNYSLTHHRDGDVPRNGHGVLAGTGRSGIATVG